MENQIKIYDLKNLPEVLPAKSRLLGLDLGEKTIGLAISDSAHQIASPLVTLQRSKFTQDAEKLRDICLEYHVGGLILGLPINMDGSEGKRAQSTRQFARNLYEVAGFSLPLAFWDERLSTRAVDRILNQDSGFKKKKRKEVIDKMAASYILQGALDSLRLLSDSE